MSGRLLETTDVLRDGLFTDSVLHRGDKSEPPHSHDSVDRNDNAFFTALEPRSEGPDFLFHQADSHIALFETWSSDVPDDNGRQQPQPIYLFHR